ncbi:MAG: hypothetical protein JSW47_11560, partial [Phycisphaerales bacterium]
MKFLTRTVIVLGIIDFAVAGSVLAMMRRSEDKTLTISGSVSLPGVEMMGLPGNPVTDYSGKYSATVPYGFTGTVRPAKEGFAFTPPLIEYAEVTGNIDNQDYIPSLIRFMISGNAGVGGAVMKGLPGDPLADRAGRYSVMVDYGWSGTATPAKEGYTFEPASMRYTRVMADRPNSNYAAKAEPSDAEGSDLYSSFGSSRSTSRRRGAAAGPDMMYDPSGFPPRGRSSGYGRTIRSVGRKALVIPAGQIRAKELAETVEDMHVMSHILDERFKETRRIRGMFTDFGAFFGRDNRGTEAIYLQG